MYIISKIRYKNKIKEYNSIKAVINLINKKNILIKIDNNSYYYNIFKKNKNYKLKILNIIYEVIINKIDYHPFLKKIKNIEFKQKW